MELEHLLPTYDVRSVFARRIPAGSATVWEALVGLTADELPITRLLMSIRSAGRTRLRGCLIETFPIPLLARVEGSELVFGVVAAFWRLRPEPAPLPLGDPEAFIAFTEPGWAKAAMSIQLAPDGDDTAVYVETRIHATDPASRRAFTRYWLVVRPGSGLLRREFLRALARRVTSSQAPRPGGA
jgi:hypothetical protein